MRPQNPVQSYRQAVLNARAAQVDPSVRQTIQAQGVASQKSLDSFKYWSTIRFQSVRSGASPNFIYTITPQQRKAFAYGAGGSATVAGFAAAYQSGLQDTNLNQPSQTNDNANFTFDRINCFIRQDQFTEARLIAEIFRVCDVQLQMSGQTIFRVGSLEQIPGGFGLFGAQSSIVSPGALPATEGQLFQYIQNGNPQAPSAYYLDQPITWAAVGGGQKDSSLNIVVNQNAQVQIAGGADRVFAAGTTAAFTAATAPYVDLTFVLTGTSVANRSQNV